MTKKLESFSIFLETSGPGKAARKLREKFDFKEIDAAITYWSGKIRIGKTTPSDIVSFLGQPDKKTENSMEYFLPLRSEYSYCFIFDKRGILIDNGYRRANILPDLLNIKNMTKNKKQYIKKLAEFGATAPEVIMLLGEPLERIGWWPVETWRYGDNIEINLRNGIVEEP
jgi:hypothetical protein